MTAITGEKLAMARRAIINLVTIIAAVDGVADEREVAWFSTTCRVHPLFADLSDAEWDALIVASEQDLEKYPPPQSTPIWAGLIPKELRTQTYDLIVRAAFADGTIKAEEATIADFLEEVLELPKDEAMAIILRAKSQAERR